MEQHVGNTRHTDAFASIAESLTSADEQDIIIGISGNGYLVRRLKRRAQILAEIHGEICQILHHDHIVLGGQFAYYLQFFFTQADPRWIVGVAIDDGADVALFQIALQLSFQLVAAIVVYVKGLVFDAHHL